MNDDFPPFENPNDNPSDEESEEKPLPPPPEGTGDAWRDELGLPHLAPNALPYSEDTFTRIIEEITHRERAFLQLHRDQPEAIVQRLDELTRIINAMLAHQGPHLPQVIHLALELEPRYWVASGDTTKGLYFFGHLFSRARDLEDAQLLGEVLAAWGLYLFLLRNREVGRNILQWALEEVEKTQRPDLRLLMRAEIFNAQVVDLSSEEAAAQADTLLREATRLNFPYIKGRVYYSLSRRYQYIGNRVRAFEYAQQSLCYFYPDNTPELVSQALGNMYLSVVADKTPEETIGAAYAQHLLDKGEEFAMRTVNPWYQAAELHKQAHWFILQGLYPRARHAILRAWLTYRRVLDRFGCAQVQHMLGLEIYPYLSPPKSEGTTPQEIARKKALYRKRADYHLRMAQKRYEALGETTYALSAYHARAYLQSKRAESKPELREALETLQDVYKAIETRVPDPEAREHMLRLVAEDIASVKRRLACGGHGEKPAAV